MLYISRVCYHHDLVCCYDIYKKPVYAIRSRNSTFDNESIYIDDSDDGDRKYNETIQVDIDTSSNSTFNLEKSTIENSTVVNVKVYNEERDKARDLTIMKFYDNITTSMNTTDNNMDTLPNFIIVGNVTGNNDTLVIHH